MKIDVLLYVSDSITDDDLTFLDFFSPELIVEILSSNKNFQNFILSLPKKYKGRLTERNNSSKRNHIDDVKFWKNLFKSSKADHIIKIFADSPFIDPIIINEMYELHDRYLAEFTFSENLPDGLGCEVISRSLIDELPDTDEKTLSLSQVVKSNINQFNIEIYYKDPDIRSSRISFLSGDVRNKKIMENIYKLNSSIPHYENLKSLIDDNPGVLYTGPSYIEIELTGKCDLDCIFCYRSKLENVHDNMELSTYSSVLDNMKIFGLPYTISFNGSGEPLQHPKFYEILEMTISDPLVNRLIVETNGIYADSNYKSFLENNRDKNIITIININGFNLETYKTIHGHDYFDKVFQNLESLKDTAGDNNSIYVQIMKINETESFMDKYYDFYENLNIPIILQKQNTYIGLLQNRTYSDLSPVLRTPCWHLQRDMVILSDGRVAFCKQDFSGEMNRGKIESISLENIWDKGRDLFIKDYNADYNKNPDCLKCDEWYTFNF